MVSYSLFRVILPVSISITYRNLHDDVMTWKHFPISDHRWTKSQWCGNSMIPLMSNWTNHRTDSWATSDLRPWRSYDDSVMGRSVAGLMTLKQPCYFLYSHSHLPMPNDHKCANQNREPTISNLVSMDVVPISVPVFIQQTNSAL